MSSKSHVGTCMSMCPASELNERRNEWFEINPVTLKYSPEFAIKKFHRSDAGKSFDQSDIRPLPVLKKTLDHIIDVVIGKLTGLKEGATEWNMAIFVRDRFRAIRQDITFQNLKGIEIIDILEKIAIFFIFCAVKFQEEPEFDPFQNFEQISQTLISLDEQYDLYFKQTGKHPQNEAEFRAAHILLYITTNLFTTKLTVLSNYVLESAAMKFVLDLRSAYNMQNIHKYVAKALSAPLHIMCAAIASAKDLWTESLYSFRASFKYLPMRPEFFTTQMFMTPSQFEKWAPYMNFETIDAGIRFKKDSLPNIIKDVKAIIPKKINLVVQGINFVDIFTISSSGNPPPIYMKPDTFANAAETQVPSSPEVQESEEKSSQESTEETNESQETSSNEEETEAQEPESEKTLPEEPKIPIQPAPLKVEPEKPVIATPRIITPPEISSVPLNPFANTVLEFKRTKIIPAALSIESIIPKDIPENCFATVGVSAGDNSPSSLFAIERFRTDGTIIFCDHINIGKSTIYLLIVRQDFIFTDFELGSHLICESNAVIDNENTPIIRFNCNETPSPYFTFDSCLRKAISLAIKEIVPLDLSSVLINEGFKYRDFQYDAFKRVFADALLSNSFRKYLVPYDHKLISRNDLWNFTNALKFSSPEYTNFGIPPFIVPIDSKFDAEQFCMNLSSEITKSTVVDGNGESSMDMLLAEFCEGLY
ncbi:SAC3/GANP family protein [Trichomonas vaginalis G3]|uniref:SAC3/GANP family protein n=1 Tax=Trichomonas vaginalis (strain ATCC PRA-98 / G3) TaxID=412133 RepID=A2FE80_TRIV3|nr:mRNA transport [Trichomonas vaginalis G3]EAX96771.1 SAC3/GANP family protein [Trichomonas vaginalis G3]KAI5552815.1 mRNA transport [Trichomonas vaginalis G3]|eukprot:XP_001309701.1 SAC3/GANP family protein [Trichomonas vaginalis G3]